MSVTIAPFAVPVEKQIAGMNASLVMDIPVMLFVMLFLTVPALVKGKLYRSQGIILLAVYTLYPDAHYIIKKVFINIII